MKKNCPLRRKLRELSRMHDYYVYLFESAGKEEADKWLKMRSRKEVKP